MVLSKKYVLVKSIGAYPTEDNFQLIEEELPPIKEGEFLSEAIYISIDPYMKGFSQEHIGHVKVGDIFAAQQIAKIIESKNPKYEVGKYVIAFFGCATHTISDGSPWSILPYLPTVISELENFPLSYYLGILGITGSSAYYGLLDICHPKKGETLVVSTAAGATGSSAGQWGKLKGCKVIGITGTDEKCKWITDELGFDYAINYKTADLKEELKRIAPEGVDMFFDNVGGEQSSIVMSQMNSFGRVSACGMVSTLSASTIPTASVVQPAIVLKQLKVEGFLCHSFLHKNPELIAIHLNLLNEGKLKYRETIYEGFENMCTALNGLLTGRNIGKTILKL